MRSGTSHGWSERIPRRFDTAGDELRQAGMRSAPLT
jgi:hypothetical protein